MLQRVANALWYRVSCLNLRKMSFLANPQEISLAVPWGHIAGRAWGDPQGKPVLALHGWLDNAGTFDALLPLLSNELYVVALDWPGHGKSSNYPPGARHCAYDYLADIQYAVEALKWDKFTFLAHSMGGGAATWFSGAVRERVECVVLLESLGFWSVDLETLPQQTGQALATLSRFDKPDTKTYENMETMLERIVQGHVGMDGHFDRKCAAILAKRGVHQLEDGSYQFTRDIRAKAPSIMRISHETNRMYVSAIQCPVLVVIGENTQVGTTIEQIMRPLKNHHIKVVKVSQGHHLHMHHPEAISQLLDSFLLQHTIPSQFEASKL